MGGRLRCLQSGMVEVISGGRQTRRRSWACLVANAEAGKAGGGYTPSPPLSSPIGLHSRSPLLHIDTMHITIPRPHELKWIRIQYLQYKFIPKFFDMELQIGILQGTTKSHIA